MWLFAVGNSAQLPGTWLHSGCSLYKIEVVKHFLHFAVKLQRRSNYVTFCGEISEFQFHIHWVLAVQ